MKLSPGKSGLFVAFSVMDSKQTVINGIGWREYSERLSILSMYPVLSLVMVLPVTD
jgi:hypothetical protein